LTFLSLAAGSFALKGRAKDLATFPWLHDRFLNKEGVSGMESSIDRAANGSAVARNYAFVLIGGIVLPFMAFAHFIARKRRDQPAGLEQSHYAFQYRTTSLALIGLLAVTLVATAIMIWMPSQTVVQHRQQEMWFIQLGNISWLVMLWIAVRCIRGLYLSAAGRAIQHPKTLWIWPQ